MNHGMAHCKGDGCMMRNTCLRYQAHLDYEADEQLKATMAVPYHDENECLPKGYSLYWKTYEQEGGEA